MIIMESFVNYFTISLYSLRGGKSMTQSAKREFQNFNENSFQNQFLSLIKDGVFLGDFNESAIT
jgi:hypothetical protein